MAISRLSPRLIEVIHLEQSLAEFKYDEWLQHFMVSVSWRVAKSMRDTLASENSLVKLDSALLRLSDYLLQRSLSEASRDASPRLSHLNRPREQVPTERRRI